MENDINKSERGIELASRQTGMAFQRTRMSADRTLMAIIRTSLSLISFGFTVFQFFTQFGASHVISANESAPANFGQALVYLGVFMLTLGILFHIQYMYALRRLRNQLKKEKMIHGDSWFPPSLSLISAVFLLLIGIAAIFNMTFKMGPF